MTAYFITWLAWSELAAVNVLGSLFSMSKHAKLCRSAILAAAVMVAVPAISHAQVVISGGSGGTISIGGSSLSTGTAAKEGAPKMVSADSLAKLRTYAKTKSPVVVIDGAVTTLKALQALPDSQIVSAVFQQSDAEVRHYGDKAKNGVLIFKTGKATTGEEAKKAEGTGKTGTFQFQIQEK